MDKKNILVRIFFVITKMKICITWPEVICSIFTYGQLYVLKNFDSLKQMYT